MSTQLLLRLLLCCIALRVVSSYTIPKEVRVGFIGPVFSDSGETLTALILTNQKINNSTELLLDTKLTIIAKDSYALPLTSVKGTLELNDEGIEIVLCCSGSGDTDLVVPTTSVLQMIQLSYSVSSDYFTANHNQFPYFARITPVYKYMVDACYGLLQYLSEWSGQSQYLNIGIIIFTRPSGVEAAREIISKAREYKARVLAYQQFISYLDNNFKEPEVRFEVEQLKKSGARVFIAVMGPLDMQKVANTSKEEGIIGESYIWICFNGCAVASTFGYSPITNTYNEDLQNTMLGMLGINQIASEGEKYAELVEDLENIPIDSPFTKLPPSIPLQYAYDVQLFIAAVIQNVIKLDGFTEDGKIKDKAVFYRELTKTKYKGVTGEIEMTSDGDRTPRYAYLNLKPNLIDFDVVGEWSPENGTQITSEILFPGNTTFIPDLDIRPPFEYWDCEKKEKGVDLTGKTIELKKPGGNNPRYIDYYYYCDQFIDCENFSDESSDGCASNYLIVFIVYGVITGVLILIALLFFLCTIIFGFISRRKRFISASPLFLIILIISCIVGYCSIFAWYGKPQQVACGFQPWLLGLSVNSMIAALCAKTFRIWRIFKSPFNRKVITDFELFILWVIIMLPAVLILALWTLISTPTATLENVDGEEHYVCETGGFTGPPGGYVFFGIFVAYSALVLCFGAFLSIVTRNVPALFNESKLISISIYHLIFLSIVTIPVIIVLKSLDPFVGWIIRTSAIIYAFTATLWIQFIPKLICLIVVDRCRKNIKTVITAKEIADLDQTSSSAFSNIPEARSYDSN